MNKQQKEIQQIFLDNEKEVLNSLKSTYEDALDEVNTKIQLLMMRDDADMQHVIYQTEYQKAMKTQLEGILNQLHANEFQTVSEYLSKCYEDGFIGTMYDLQGQGIPLVIPIDQKQVVAAIQHETKLSEGLYTALGKDIKDLQKKISGEVSRGISTGQMYSEISRNISSYAGISRSNATRIARTEGHRIQCQATMDAQWKAKDKGADVVKQWDASLDGKTRDSHRKLDGQIRELDEDFEVDGMTAEAPGMFGDPAEDCNCRCALLQRARWALEDEVEATKWAEDAPVLIDDDGTTQFVDISDAKNYEQFKERYLKTSNDIEGADSGSVRRNAQKISKNVYALKEYEIDGITYKVDGKHVVLDITQNEKDVAQLVGSYLGKEVEIIPRIVFPQGISTPDYIISGKKYDLKEPLSNGKHAFYNMINKKKKQADNFIFDISKSSIADDAISDQIKDVYGSSHTLFVNNIIVVKNGKVIDTFDRNK